MALDPELLKTYISTNNDRFDRIEEKLDRLTDTVVALARAEEKLISLEHSRQHQDEIIQKMRKDLDSAWATIRDNKDSIDTFKKALWTLFTGVIGLVAKILFGV